MPFLYLQLPVGRVAGFQHFAVGACHPEVVVAVHHQLVRVDGFLFLLPPERFGVDVPDFAALRVIHVDAVHQGGNPQLVVLAGA